MKRNCNLIAGRERFSRPTMTDEHCGWMGFNSPMLDFSAAVRGVEKDLGVRIHPVEVRDSALKRNDLVEIVGGGSMVGKGWLKTGDQETCQKGRR